MRGLGTIFRMRGSRFFWMQYFVSGERFRESTKCDRLKDAQQVLKNKLVEIEQQTGTGSSGPATIADLYILIENDYTRNGRKSLAHLKATWKNHLSLYFAPLPTRKLSSEQIETYVARRLGDGAANASVNRELAALKRMFNLAIKSGRLKSKPYISTLKERNVRTGFVKDATYKALARETANVGLWLCAMFEVAYTYGWRRSELTTLRVRQVDLDQRSIDLNPGETKNGEGRFVGMTTRVHELLSQCIAGKSADDFVFTRPDGRPVGNFRRAWSKACVAAGTPGLLIHDLRRSGARNMRRDGVSEKVIMRITGHKTRSMFDRYNIVDPSDLRDAAQKIEKGSQQRTAEEDPGELALSGHAGNDAVEAAMSLR